MSNRKMPALCYRKNRGLTLIEVMIVVVIIGILVAVALPSYQNYTLESKRTEGTGELLRIMDLQERYYTNQFPPTYTTTMTDLGYAPGSVLTENGNYEITAKICTGELITSCVQLTATAQSGQANDGNLTLNSLGKKTRGGNAGWE